jgi:dihydroorotate dehydrogenase
VETLDDVLDLMAVGATAVALGTSLFRDPSLALQLRDQLAA